jgi:hypothetical protein
MTEAPQWPKRLPSLSVRRSTIAVDNIPVFEPGDHRRELFSATRLRHGSRNARIADLAQATSPRSIAPVAITSRC